MSKIGRQPIDVKGLQIDINGLEVRYKGPKASGTYTIDSALQVKVEDQRLFLTPREEGSREHNRVWGLHRALLANKLHGAVTEFEKKIEINGLGFKAAITGDKMVFALGFSHKIDLQLPKGVTVEIDKTGQKLAFKSVDKELLGHVCSVVRSFRPPEPYKGTGIKYANEVIIRKAGKASSK